MGFVLMHIFGISLFNPVVYYIYSPFQKALIVSFLGYLIF
jgi:hypothetical protein